ncbi:hypothetical protein NE865_03826 [Phthorimaea operculella]|nr:hypothetical protein NE865_03826 [Phthorimaea operculella]
MSQILNKLRDVDPNNSEAVKEALSPFFQQLSKHTEVNSGLWLKTLENAINRFPKYCMSQRENIETYLAHFLNSSNYYIVIEAAKCAHALQQVRPTQEKTATAKSCWRDQMNALCSAAHALLTAMFPNAVDIYQQTEKTQKEQPSSSPLAVALTNLSSATAKTQNSSLTRQAVLSNRLRNVFIFIQAMLVEVYPVAKPIRPQTVLDVIVRALSVTSGKNIQSNAEVTAVKTQALRSLHALVTCVTSGKNIQSNAEVTAVKTQALRSLHALVACVTSGKNIQSNAEVTPVKTQALRSLHALVACVTSGKNIQSNAEVTAVKTQALRSLHALVACLGPNLIPFSPLVFRCVMQTLKWCSDYPSEQSSKVRCTAYNTLSLWLTTLQTHKTSDRTRSWEDELTEYILADITPQKHTVELKMSSQPTKNLSKKAKRKLANSMMMESNIASHMPGEKNKKANMTEELNEKVATAALQCAQTFFIVCGVFLKPTTYKRFQEHVVRACYTLSTPGNSLGLHLLRTLERMRVCAPPTAHAHAHHALEVYSVHANSRDTEISNFCSQALLNIRLQLHCAPPTLSFAADVPIVTETEEEKKKGISARNRAALEELLGKDKVPKQTESEEVITIADEPANKKRKVDQTDDTDKISLSSDSNSIEISDASDTDDIVVQEDVEVVIEHVDNEKVNPEEEINIEPIVDEVESVNGNGVDDVGIVRTKTADSNDIHMQETQLPKPGMDISEDKVDSTQPDNEPKAIYDAETQLPPNTTIFEAATQLPLHISNDDEDETPLSMEVAYDYPNTGTEKIPVLEKLDGDNLPSTNDTDDIQITCGQDVKYSQDDEAKKSQLVTNEVKVNGVDSTEKPLQNGDITKSSEAEVTAVTSKELNVEDMLADFVDEVNDDPTQPTQA